MTILFNSLLIKFLINYYQKDKILINKDNITLINNHINYESNKYFEKLKNNDYH